jgi:phosphatidylinositol-3-phosphatase
MYRPARTRIAGCAAALLAAGVALTGGAAPAARAAGVAPVASPAVAPAVAPAVKHVWVIELENESYTDTFGHPGQAPYLARTLVKEGGLLKNYYGIAHDSLPNYLAEVSGQAPNFQTGNDCGIYSPFLELGGENFSGFTKYGQLTGDGCRYPKSVKTVADQLGAAHRGWKAYEQDMGIDPKRDGTTKTAAGPACGHPVLGKDDLTDDEAPANDSYATRHDPFMYFQSITGNRAYCDAHVVPLAPLAKDLKSSLTTPAYSFVTPNTCSDAHDIPKCQNGAKGGMGQADTFLAHWVPTIMKSPAYKQGGLIAIVFDESSDDTQAQACCGEKLSLGYDDPTHPNTNEPGLYGPGGGRTGALLLSPFIKPGTLSTVPYNHYSLLRSVEDFFHLSHLGDAAQPGVTSFGGDVWTRPKA